MVLHSPVLTRRSFLKTSAAFVAVTTVPILGVSDAKANATRNSPAQAAPRDVTGSAIAFDGDALIAADGTLSRSDGGGAWTPLPVPAGASILALATHPDRPARIAAGLSTGGIVLSEDGGRTWEVRSQGLPVAAITAITVAAAKPDTLYAAVRGDGLWKSEDTGRSWSFAMDRPWLADAERDLTALTSVELATGMGGIWLYAGTDIGLTRVPDCFCRWQDVQPGDAMDALVSGSSSPPEAPLPQGARIDALVSAASLPTRLYAGLPSGIWVSDDAGVVWSQRSSTRAEAIAVHPANADDVVIITPGGLTRSSDGGMTWTAVAPAERRTP